MLDAAIYALAKVDIYARCYASSATMIEMFRRRDFQLLDQEPDGNLVFKRRKMGSDEVVSAQKTQKLKPFVQIPT